MPINETPRHTPSDKERTETQRSVATAEAILLQVQSSSASPTVAKHILRKAKNITFALEVTKPTRNTQ